MPLDLTQLLPLIEEMPAYRQLVDELGQSSAKVAVLDAAKPYLIAALYQSLHRPMMVVTAQPENSKKLYEQLLAWCDSSQVKLFPEPDTLPYERITADNSTEMEKLQVLSALANINGDDGTSSTVPPLIVASSKSG